MPSPTFLKAYLHHQLFSQNIYKIHSPYVFSFYNRVIRERGKEPFFNILEGQRSSLIKDQTRIPLQDLGAGSGGVLHSDRKIMDIAKGALKPASLAQLLGRSARFLNPGIIIELGTSLGITTSYLSHFCPNAQIFTLEGSPAIAKIALHNFSKLGIKNIELIQGNFDYTLPEVLKSIPAPLFPLFSQPFGLQNPKTQKNDSRLVFVDGNHRFKSTLDYFQILLSQSSEEDVFIFDDIHWSQEMQKAWMEIQNHKSVTLTLDLFYFGFVFFKRDRAKEHFKLRNR